MSFDKTFCPSPWLHMRIVNDGGLEFCRFASRSNIDESPATIKDISIDEYFKSNMSSVRLKMLQGEKIDACQNCHAMEQHGKVSGRQRQLLKAGIDPDNFFKTIISSPFFEEFKKSLTNLGQTDLMPQDWQIDLGNFCNSGCVFCHPASSSKLAVEWKKLNLINELPPSPWCEDSNNIRKLVESIKKSGPGLKYLHFIGGETLITPAFSQILHLLISSGISDRVMIGFTTNLTTWDSDIIRLFEKFNTVHIGVSLETLNKVNNYVRWPSQIESVKTTLERWIDIKKGNGWAMSLRITPTILTIKHLPAVFEYAYSQSLTIESCNFLENPAFMRPSVLPMDHRREIIDAFDNWIVSKKSEETYQPLYNIRHPDFAKQQVLADAKSYINYLKTMPDESTRFPALIEYLKKIESSRGNSVLDYLPEYEDLFRSFGY